ncbi:hypothetical protein [Streptomyces malaysiensis]
MTNTDQRWCNGCGKFKALDQFYLKNRSTGRRDFLCKSCRSTKTREAGSVVTDGVSGWAERNIRAKASKLGLSAEEYRELRDRPCDVCQRPSTEDAPNSPMVAPDDAVVGTWCRKCASAWGFLGKDVATLDRLRALMAKDD